MNMVDAVTMSDEEILSRDKSELTDMLKDAVKKADDAEREFNAACEYREAIRRVCGRHTYLTTKQRRGG